MFRNSTRIFVLCCLPLSGVLLHSTPIISNGSLTGPVTNGAIPGPWTIVSGNPDTMDQNNNTGVPSLTNFVSTPAGPSPDGGTWVGLGRDGGRFVEEFAQLVSGFTPGSQYKVSWFAGNFGSGGYNGANSISLIIDNVLAGSGLVLSVDPAWAAQSVTFTAGKADLNVGFRLTSAVPSYLSIDGIGVAALPAGVPEPASGLLVAGALLGGFWMRRRAAVTKRVD